MNTTRALLVLVTTILLTLAYPLVVNVSGMNHQVQVSRDLSAWAVVLVLVLAWYGLYMRLWFLKRSGR